MARALRRVWKRTRPGALGRSRWATADAFRSLRLFLQTHRSRHGRGEAAARPARPGDYVNYRAADFAWGRRVSPGCHCLGAKNRPGIEFYPRSRMWSFGPAEVARLLPLNQMFRGHRAAQARPHALSKGTRRSR